MSTVCPKCEYERQETDRASASECPRCGVIYAKWRPHVVPLALEPPPPENYIREEAFLDEDEPPASLARQILSLFVTVRNVSSAELAGHAVVYLIFFLWGWKFVFTEYRGTSMAGSFMHNIDLVFHEAGHILFRPFGDFMSVLGGSLTQLLVPLLIIVAFLVKNRDPFGASIGLWWLGQSFKDLAPYIHDAKELTLPLLGGITGADNPHYHDWRNILSRLGMLDWAYTLGWWANLTGVALMIGFMIWGGYALAEEYRNLKREFPE